MHSTLCSKSLAASAFRSLDRPDGSPTDPVAPPIYSYVSHIGERYDKGQYQGYRMVIVECKMKQRDQTNQISDMQARSTRVYAEVDTSCRCV